MEKHDKILRQIGRPTLYMESDNFEGEGGINMSVWSVCGTLTGPKSKRLNWDFARN